MRKVVLAAAAAVILLGGCGSGDGAGGAGSEDAHAHDHGHEHSHEDDGAAGFAFGLPGDPASAARTIEVVADDRYRFDPPELEVEPGETVTFVVTNEGDELHEFVLGDRDYQEAHGEQMASGSAHHEGNAVSVAPGATEELTWTFPAEGEVLYGCHVAGHFDAGMVGAIRVSA